MRNVDRYFLVLASLCMIAGVCLGIWMGIMHDFQLAPVHAHLNLLGWASLALFGLIYRCYPALARSRLAAWHFALSAPSAALFPLGIYMSVVDGMPALAIAASLVWLAGSLVFAAGLVRIAVPKPGTSGLRLPATHMP